jgi:ATP phosphoribosyltransferase-like protein
MLTTMFATRPELRGSFGMVSSTHWLASATGMAVLERGGNAFDAAVAAGFVLQVVEPHLNGPGGEVPILVAPAGLGRVLVVNGQGPVPAAASIERFAELGLPVRIFPSYGATEAKVPEIVDAVVDLTETGSTLRRHGMVVVATLLTSFTQVVANPESAADPARRQAMDDLVTLLVGAATARSKTLIKLNVADSDLARVLAVLPSMKAPTVNELADSGFHAVETVVDKAGVNRLIPTLKAAGAFDILELPIAKIVE